MRRFKFATLMAILAVLLTGANPLWAQYGTGPKLTIINHSGYAANQVYLAFLAIPYGDDPNFHHIIWQHDEFLPIFPRIDPIDNTETVEGANNNPYANYSTTLDRLSIDSNGNHYFYIPQGVTTVDNKGCHGRLWLSFKKPMYFHVDSATGYAQPSISNDGDANFYTVFDFFEPAVTSDDAVHADTTNVDMVAMSMLYELKNGDSSLGIKGFNRSVGALRQAFLGDPVFSALVTPTRIVCPGQAGDLNPPLAFPADYFDKYRDYCWQHWTDNPLTFEYPLGTTWTGGVTGEVLTLAGPQTVTISRPPSKDIFLCNGVFDGSNEVDKAIKNQVVSALNRTVFHLDPYPTGSKTEYPWQSYKPPTGYGAPPNNKMFYQQNGLTAANYKTNVYSKLLHQLSYDGTIYGFAYDDNAKQASYIDGVATDIILTINNSRPTSAPLLNLLLED